MAGSSACSPQRAFKRKRTVGQSVEEFVEEILGAHGGERRPRRREARVSPSRRPQDEAEGGRQRGSRAVQWCDYPAPDLPLALCEGPSIALRTVQTERETFTFRGLLLDSLPDQLWMGEGVV